MYIFLNYREECKLKLACIVDIDHIMGSRLPLPPFEFDIYLCPIDTYCKPFGDTGFSAVFGYVR